MFAAEVIATWAARFISSDHPAAPAPAATAPVVVGETGQGTFLNHVVVGEHRFLADEPVSVGGFDAGPAPYDLLSAALGTCTSMTLRLYADRKKLALDRVIVEVTHAKTHATDSNAVVDGKTPMIDQFERRLVLEGELSEDDRASLLRIADRCPVHRTLEASSHIVTTLA